MQRVSRRQEYRTPQHCVEYASVGSYTSGPNGPFGFPSAAIRYFEWVGRSEVESPDGLQRAMAGSRRFTENSDA